MRVMLPSTAAATPALRMARRGWRLQYLDSAQSLALGERALALAAGNDLLFGRLCRVLDLPDLVQDERFATNGARVLNRDALIPVLAGRAVG